MLIVWLCNQTVICTDYWVVVTISVNCSKQWFHQVSRGEWGQVGQWGQVAEESNIDTKSHTKIFKVCYHKCITL